MKIKESAENYLETILILSNRNGSVRSIDVANELGFSKPSVSVAMKNLREKQLITIDKDSCIALSKTGEEIAKKVYERHNILCETLEKIGVSKQVAEEDACKIEHIISDETFNCLKNFLKK